VPFIVAVIALLDRVNGKSASYLLYFAIAVIAIKTRSSVHFLMNMMRWLDPGHTPLIS